MEHIIEFLSFTSWLDNVTVAENMELQIDDTAGHVVQYCGQRRQLPVNIQNGGKLSRCLL